ncbi:MAG: tetratricopeptide repeat protein, partial [Thermodesulfobacteriota bacterium]
MRIVVSAFFIFAVLLVFSPIASALVITINDSDLRQGIEDLKEENYEEAAESLEKAKRKYPDSAVPAYYLGLAYKNMQEFTKAAENLKLASTMRPGVKEAIFDLAEMYYHTGEHVECLKQIEIAEVEETRPADTAFLKGLLFTQLKRPRHAVQAFRKAKKLNPGMTQAADYQAGLVLMRMGNLK